MNETEQTYHVPVLLHESIEGMHIQPGGTYVDVTFGGGGHSKGILSAMDATGRLFSFDQDQDAERNIVDDKRFTFVRSNFRYLHNFLRYYGVDQVDAILADLGVSSHHFDDSERGFSFRFDGQLDMRMNKRAGMTAADIVNTYDEERLADIFYLYGELKNSRKLGCCTSKSPYATENSYHRRLPGNHQAPVRKRTGKERTRQSIPGTPHRGESGNGSAERNVVCGYRSFETGRQTRYHHLSFPGRPDGKERHEDRKRGRESRKRFLRQHTDTFQTGKQQSDCTF